MSLLNKPRIGAQKVRLFLLYLWANEGYSLLGYTIGHHIPQCRLDMSIERALKL